MKPLAHRSVGAAVACGLVTGAAARAQQPIVHYTMSWHDTGNNNGVLEPGESAVLAVNVAFTPPVGSPISYTPPPGTGMGTIAGLSSVAFDLVGNNCSRGVWDIDPENGHGASWGWDVGQNGVVQADGSVFEVHAAQMVAPGGTANSSNPIAPIWQGVWTPASYSGRGVLEFSLQPAQSAGVHHTGLLVQYGLDPNGRPLYTTVYVPADFGTLQIWMDWGPPPYPCGCYANCDGSVTPPFLNVDDFVCFQNRFAAGDSRANCDQSTTPPTLNVNDFLCFMRQFALQCY